MTLKPTSLQSILSKNSLVRLLLVPMLGLLAGCDDNRSTYSIATGGTAGLYYPYGGGMASIWSARLNNINVKAEVTGGSVINVIQVARKESEMGIAMADVVTSAYVGGGRFPEPLPLRVLFTAYPNIVHILSLAESEFDSVASLGGKRVALGAAGSGTAVAANNVLTSLGVDDIAPVYLNFAETTSALKDGTIDAGFVVGGLGIAAVTELSVTRNLKLIPLTTDELVKLNQDHPAYSRTDIPALTYNGVDSDVQALGIWSVVVVHEDMPNDVARALTCTIYAHRESLLKISAVAKSMTVDNIRKLSAVPLHNGTLEYLEDTGVACGAG